MIWAAPLLVAVAAAAPAGGKVASTYDEAACSDAEIARAEPREDERDCSEPEPIPAVIDCNDTRASFMAEMIGSCDMPRPSTSTPPTVNAAGRALRVCTGDRCGVEQLPARAAFRPLDLGTPALPSALDFPYYNASARLDGALLGHVSQTEGGGLDRPPRA